MATELLSVGVTATHHAVGTGLIKLSMVRIVHHNQTAKSDASYRKPTNEHLDEI